MKFPEKSSRFRVVHFGENLQRFLSKTNKILKKMKDYCFTGTNLTLAFIQRKDGNLMVVHKKRLSGLLGDVISKCLRLDRPNFCSFQPVESFGSLAPNGSVSGVLKSVASSVQC